MRTFPTLLMLLLILNDGGDDDDDTSSMVVMATLHVKYMDYPTSNAVGQSDKAETDDDPATRHFVLDTHPASPSPKSVGFLYGALVPSDAELVNAKAFAVETFEDAPTYKAMRFAHLPTSTSPPSVDSYKVQPTECSAACNYEFSVKWTDAVLKKGMKVTSTRIDDERHGITYKFAVHGWTQSKDGHIAFYAFKRKNAGNGAAAAAAANELLPAPGARERQTRFSLEAHQLTSTTKHYMVELFFDAKENIFFCAKSAYEFTSRPVKSAAKRN